MEGNEKDRQRQPKKIKMVVEGSQLRGNQRQEEETNMAATITQYTNS